MLSSIRKKNIEPMFFALHTLFHTVFITLFDTVLCLRWLRVKIDFLEGVKNADAVSFSSCAAARLQGDHRGRASAREGYEIARFPLLFFDRPPIERFRKLS